MSLHQALSNHIDSHKTHGAVWPADAEYAIVHACACWPTYWSTASTVITFFRSKEELLKKLEEQREWCRLEDNYMARRVFRWDLGPVEMPEYEIGDGYELSREAINI